MFNPAYSKWLAGTHSVFVGAMLTRSVVVAFAIVEEPNNHNGEWVWQKFLPEALANGTFQAKPDPLPIGHGLGDLQKGLDAQQKGVSARKFVVPL